MGLRPLDLAAIFSNAATVYARNAARFIAMILSAIVPLTIAQYFVTLREQPQIDATMAWMQLPQKVQAAHLPPIFNTPDFAILTLASFVLTYIVMAFGVAAVGAGVAAALRNEKVSFRSCMLVSLHRWRAVAGVVILLLLLGVTCVGVVTVAMFVPLAAVVAIVPAAGSIVAAFGFFIVLVACCALATMMTVVGACAVYAAALEDCSPAEAVIRALRRTCNRAELGRALVCASIVSAIVIAATASADIAGFTLMQHRAPLYFALDALVRSIVVPFAAIVFAVYYVDLRVRQEGYDLQLHVDRLGAGVHGDVRYAPTRYLSGEERAIVADFIERRHTLDRPFRRELAARIAAPVRLRVPPDLAVMDDEALLERL